MEKDPQPDSLTDVTVKQYAASEVYSTEPPPAYHRPQSTAVQVARIIALTVVAVSVVLGGFILAAAYVQANASCTQFQQEMQLLQEEQRLQQSYAPLQPEALVQEDPHKQEQHENKLDTPSHESRDTADDSSSDDSSDDDSSEEDDRTPIHIKLPLQLDFDELAGALMEKNQRSRMNCIVEKKKAEEVIDHQAKTVRLPFGVNLTTDPRYEHVTGERMAIFCESGDEQRHVPQQQQEETMMVQPIIVPLGGPMMPFSHLPQQHQQPRPEQMEAIRAHTIIMEQLPPRQPMHVPVPAQHQVPPQPHPNQIPPQMHPPTPLMHQIAQQIIHQETLRQQQEAMRQEPRPQANMPHMEAHMQPHMQPHIQPHMMRPQAMPEHVPEQVHQLPEALVAHRLHQVPEEVLTQINRLPQEQVQHVISVSVQEDPEERPEGRQGYAREMNVVPMQMEQARPHYVQPRSVRSVDNILHREKRVKRCSCDCAC